MPIKKLGGESKGSTQMGVRPDPQPSQHILPTPRKIVPPPRTRQTLVLCEVTTPAPCTRREYDGAGLPHVDGRLVA